MTTSFLYSIFDIDYPESDGLPMAESDATRDYLIYGVEALTSHFQDHSDVYISGNLFIYYEQGNPKAVVAPDVFVVFGVEKKKRPSYKLWQEHNKVPDFVLEVTSKSTASEDCGTKRGLYAYLGVKEYFQYDPTSDYLQPPLQGFRLIEGNYLQIPSQTEDGKLSVFSQVLGLELQRFDDGEMRFYNPNTGKKLNSPLENDQARQEAEKGRQQAEQARQQAEYEMSLEQQKVAKLEERLRQLGIDPDPI